VVGEGGLLSHSGLGMWPSPTRCVGRGAGDTPVPFVLVKDVVDAFVAAMDAPGIEGLAFNLAGDVRPTAREFVRTIGERTARDFRFVPRPLAAQQALEVVKWLVKAAGRKKDNPFPSWHDLKSRTMARWIDNRLAKRRLGWVPTSDPKAFLDEAIGPHVRPMAEGDLRARAVLP
jgi:nucleoside-diphosphate-sugar epimerase